MAGHPFWSPRVRELVPYVPGEQPRVHLRERGILVRHFAQPRIEQFLRISMGTPAQCDALLIALRGLLVAKP